MANILDDFIANVFRILTGTAAHGNIIKKHTCNLEGAGEISFPTELKCWGAYRVDKPDLFVRKFDESDREEVLKELSDALAYSIFKISRYKVINNRAHLFFERRAIYSHTISAAITQKRDYGKSEVFNGLISIKLDGRQTANDLSWLRMSLIKVAAENLLKCVTAKNSNLIKTVVLSQTAGEGRVLCGAVIDDRGVKDSERLACDFYDRRIEEMRNISQYRYGPHFAEARWDEHFRKLGEASVKMELLANKPHKCIKISLVPSVRPNRTPLFVFYNYARLTALVREFNNMVIRRVYPPLRDVNEINFDLLNQPEEWELAYVYLLQYPSVLKNCIKDIEGATLNTQYLVTFLINWSSLFSAYYSKCRVLVEPREHLFDLIHARIYLITALRWVVYNSLRVLGIEPVTEM